MRVREDPKIGLGAALVAIVIGGIVLSAAFVHLTWWRTATSVSRDLVEVLETQITDAVLRQWWALVGQVEGMTQTIVDLLDQPDNTIPVDSILTATSLPAKLLSWLVLVPPQGDVVAVQSRADASLRVIHVGDGQPAEIVRDTAAQPAAADQSAPAMFLARGERWLARAEGTTDPFWIELAATPDAAERGVAFVSSTRRGVLAAMIGYDRFAQLLGSIAVGKTGRSYVLGPDGSIVVVSQGAEPLAPLDQVALAAGRLVAARPDDGKNVEEKVRVEIDGAGYAVGLSPLWFQGWQLAVIMPEAEFLGVIDSTIQRLAIGLAVFLLIAGILVAIGARRFVADPVARVAEDLRAVERFDLDCIPRRRSHLREIDRLSEAINRMAAGLADFGKFIPTELVRSLVASGVRAEPGGDRREITVLFADLAGFTTLSERLGDRVVPIVGSFLELASQAIEEEGGTIDKFIGDAIMAFWGAPAADDDQALHACRAALKIADRMRSLPAVDEHAGQLRVRLGIATGPAIVGNVGSVRRLNYTALGDTVNLASRLEAVNKIYGTTILLSSATRQRAGDTILAREIDTVAVYGRLEGDRVFELVGLPTEVDPTPTLTTYAAALAFYRQGSFQAALALLDTGSTDSTDDGPSRWLARRCRQVLAATPEPGWRPVTHLDMK